MLACVMLHTNKKSNARAGAKKPAAKPSNHPAVQRIKSALSAHGVTYWRIYSEKRKQYRFIKFYGLSCSLCYAATLAELLRKQLPARVRLRARANGACNNLACLAINIPL